MFGLPVVQRKDCFEVVRKIFLENCSESVDHILCKILAHFEVEDFDDPIFFLKFASTILHDLALTHAAAIAFTSLHDSNKLADEHLWLVKAILFCVVSEEDKLENEITQSTKDDEVREVPLANSVGNFPSSLKNLFIKTN